MPDTMSSKKKKVIILSSAGAVLALIITVSILTGKQERIEVQTSKVERQEELKSIVSASGEIRAKEFVDIQAEIPGVIVELHVKEGDRVQKGDLLLRIDPVQTTAEMQAVKSRYEAAIADVTTQEVQIAQAQVNLQRDKAQIRQTTAELAQARDNYRRSKKSFERIQQLNEDNLVSRDEYERAQNEMRSFKTQIETTEARLDQLDAQNRVTELSIEQMKSVANSATNRAHAARADLARSRNQLSKTTIRSPLTGIITKKNVEVGERAVPGIQSNPQATLLTIADLSVIQIELKVDETDIVNISIGNDADVKVDALPDQIIKGKVTEIGSSPIQVGVTPTQEAKDFKVIVELIEPPDVLKTGLSATADIIAHQKYDLLSIPFQALTVREVEIDDEGNYVPPNKDAKEDGTAVSANSDRKKKKKELEGVFVIDEEKKARFRPVKTGITGETDIEVLEGLKEKEEIISGSYKTIRTLTEGAAIKINNGTKTDKSS